jgi:hypothetical protein
MTGRSIELEKELIKQLFDLLELDMKEEVIVNHYLADHNLSNFFTDYEILKLSSSTNQKIETIKLLVE